MTDINKYQKVDDEFLILWNKTMVNDSGNMYFKVKDFIHQSLSQNNKAWLERVEGLKVNLRDGDNTKIISIEAHNNLIDNLVNKFKEGKE